MQSTVLEPTANPSIRQAEPLDLVIRGEMEAPLGDAHDV